MIRLTSVRRSCCEIIYKILPGINADHRWLVVAVWTRGAYTRIESSISPQRSLDDNSSISAAIRRCTSVPVGQRAHIVYLSLSVVARQRPACFLILSLLVFHFFNAVQTCFWTSRSQNTRKYQDSGEDIILARFRVKMAGFALAVLDFCSTALQLLYSWITL